MQRILFALCAAALTTLFAGMMLAVARRRAAAGGPPAIHASAAADYLWAVIPWLMISVCLIPAARRILAGH